MSIATMIKLDGGTGTALVTALSIYFVGRAGRLTDWACWAPLQYVGQLSYAIYLVHLHVGPLVQAVILRHLTGPSPSTAARLATLGLALLVIWLNAEILHRWVEKPSVALAKRLKRHQQNLTMNASVSQIAA